MNKVCIIDSDPSLYQNLLEDLALPELHIVSSKGDGQAIEPDCNILFGRPKMIAEHLPAFEGVEWVQSTFAGIDALCSADLPNNYMLTGIKGVLGSLMSEYVFTYLLAIERRLLETQHHQQKLKWKGMSHRGIQGMTLGVLGLGDIGSSIAQMAKHFGMRVLGFNRSGASNPVVEEVFSGASQADFLSQLDYLVITLPGTVQTRHFVDYQVLKQMKPSAVLINVGRGSVVNERDLVRALQEQVIRGAVLDVFEKEPLPKESPLWKMTNVFITPHNAADVLPEDIAAIFAENYIRFLKKKELRYLIDFERGY
ncbi:MAG: D-2-hydroxyacid dehydrogenase [SAR324 cluster bacterium]|nr:D-2-hydroxyacid dehydrogenase [SAR324 cluster bacterium]